MLVAFFDRDNDELSDHTKGKLFERFARRLLRACGYTDLSLNAKHSSLEYDVEGIATVSRRRVIGEAKAHDRPIPGKEVSAFAGKLLTFSGEGDFDAIFLAKTDLTAEARDYLRNIEQRNVGFRIRTLVGDEIATLLTERSEIISEDILRRDVETRYQLHPHEAWLVVCSTGEFIVVTCGATSGHQATHFLLYDDRGCPIELPPSELSRLQIQLSDVRGLIAGASHKNSLVPLEADDRSLPSVAAGVGWFDYRFPAPPDYFIGRTAELEQCRELIAQILSSQTATRAVQILARSGVGKSSLLLKLASITGVLALTIDARSLRSGSDVRVLASQLSELMRNNDIPIASPRSKSDLQRWIQSVGDTLQHRDRAVLVLLDQFESILQLPEVFDELVSLIETTTVYRHNICWVLARKNDLAATYDDSARIDLSRLTELSVALYVPDFTPDDSGRMLSELESEIGERLRPQLGQQIREFSGGFPWLHKRLCAHVLSMRQRNITQEELIFTGLRAEDLFAEDLSGLSEPDKVFLKALAANLPATASDLALKLEFEATPQRLRDKLYEFLSRKLIRLSGDVYDTYNDVFKTFLVTDRVPFRARYVFRVTPKPAIDLLERIAIYGEPIETSTLMADIGERSNYLLNKLRELRLLGLILPQVGRVGIEPEARKALEERTFPELLRRSLRRNALVVSVLDELANQQAIDLDRLVELLKSQLNQLQLSSATWRDYASNLATWLSFSGLAKYEANILSLLDRPPSSLIQKRNFLRGTFPPEVFLPKARPRFLARLVEALRSESQLPMSELYSLFGKKASSGILADAQALQIVVIQGNNVLRGPQGEVHIQQLADTTAQDIARLAIAKINVRAMLDEIGLGKTLTIADQQQITLRFGTAQWTEGTWKWQLSRLRTWLTATGLANVERGNLIPTTPTKSSSKPLGPDIEGQLVLPLYETA